MKKELDKLKEKMKLNKRMLLFLVVLLMIGILAGSLFIIILNHSDKTMVKDYLDSFVNRIKLNQLNYGTAFFNSLINHICFISIIWLLGISVIGIPIIIFLFFTKAFVLGFSVASIILNYKFSGCLFSFTYVFPHQVINLLIYIFLVIYAWSFSMKLIQSMIKKKNFEFKYVMNKYLFVLLSCFIGILITTIFEVFVTPAILKLIIPILK